MAPKGTQAVSFLVSSTCLLRLKMLTVEVANACRCVCVCGLKAGEEADSYIDEEDADYCPHSSTCDDDDDDDDD